jgi:hypothetical protein
MVSACKGQICDAVHTEKHSAVIDCFAFRGSEEHKKDLIEMPIYLQPFKQTMIALTVPVPKMIMMPQSKLATPTQPSKHGRPSTSNYY